MPKKLRPKWATRDQLQHYFSEVAELMYFWFGAYLNYGTVVTKGAFRKYI